MLPTDTLAVLIQIIWSSTFSGPSHRVGREVAAKNRILRHPKYHLRGKDHKHPSLVENKGAGRFMRSVSLTVDDKKINGIEVTYKLQSQVFQRKYSSK